MPVDPSLQSFAEQLREFEMPRPIFKGSERSEWAAGIYNNSHTMPKCARTWEVLLSNGSHGQIEEAFAN